MIEHKGRFPRVLHSSLLPLPVLHPPNYCSLTSLPAHNSEGLEPQSQAVAGSPHDLHAPHHYLTAAPPAGARSGEAACPPGAHLVYQHINNSVPFAMRGQDCEPLMLCVLGLRSVLADQIVTPATEAEHVDCQQPGATENTGSSSSSRERTEIERPMVGREHSDAAAGKPHQAADDEWWESEEEEAAAADGAVADVQPWARKRRNLLQEDQTGKVLQQAAEVDKKKYSDRQPQPQPQQRQQQPLEVTCVGGPFFRFLRTETAKNTMAAAPGGGGGWYHIKQPEWRQLRLAGGFKEFRQCLTSWPSQRLLAEVPLATLTPPPLAIRQAVAQAAASAAAVSAAAAAEAAPPPLTAGTSAAATGAPPPPSPFPPSYAGMPWEMQIAPEAAIRFGHSPEANTAADKSGGAAAGAGLKLSSVPRSGTEGERKGGGGKALEEAMQLLCVWLPGSLLLRPMLAAAAAQGAVPQQNPADAAALAATLASSLAQPGWCSGASVALRWWSAGSLEPLRAEPTDRLLVQVSGATHVVVVEAKYALDCLSPFPNDHPYDGYSAPGVAATACRPRPLKPSACAKKQHSAPQPDTQANSSTNNTTPKQGHHLRATDSETTSQQQQMTLQEVQPQHHHHHHHHHHQQQQQYNLQLARAETEADEVEAGVLELWPGFARAQGKEAILHPGDSLFVPAGSFVHVESLPDGEESTATCRSSTPGIELPGNSVLVCNLWASSPTLAPRSVGALELQAARIVERWAKHCSGSVCRVREMLLAAADRFDAAAAQTATEPASSASSLPKMQQQVDGLASSSTPLTSSAHASSAPHPLSWVSFPCSAQSLCASAPRQGAVSKIINSSSSSTSNNISSMASAAFSAWPPAHWVHHSSWDQQRKYADSSECKSTSGSSVSTGGSGSAEGGASRDTGDRKGVSSGQDSKKSALGSSSDSRALWPPTWDGWQSLPGWWQVELGKRLLALCSPLVSATQMEQKLQQQQGKTEGVPPLSVGPSCMVAGVAQLLRRCCEGRLLPTTWLNKLAHNDPLLLADVPYQYAIEFRNNDEARFPELFKPQLERREAKARKQAAAAHLARQKLLLQEGKQRQALQAGESFLLQDS